MEQKSQECANPVHGECLEEDAPNIMATASRSLGEMASFMITFLFLLLKVPWPCFLHKTPAVSK